MSRGANGYDIAWFDLEHRSFSTDSINTQSLACRATGIDRMVRIVKGGYFSPMQALEFGANGRMIPQRHSAHLTWAPAWSLHNFGPIAIPS